MIDQAGLEQLKKNAGWTIALGVILVIVGVLAIGSPLMTGITLAYLIGSLLLVSGVFQMVYAFRARSWGAGLLGFFGGLLSVVAGLLVLAHPIFGLKFMTLLLAAYFFVDGITSIVGSFQMRPAKGWGWTLFGGIVALLLGIVIWRQWPLSGAWAIACSSASRSSSRGGR